MSQLLHSRLWQVLQRDLANSFAVHEVQCSTLVSDTSDMFVFVTSSGRAANRLVPIWKQVRIEYEFCVLLFKMVRDCLFEAFD